VLSDVSTTQWSRSATGSAGGRVVAPRVQCPHQARHPCPLIHHSPHWHHQVSTPLLLLIAPLRLSFPTHFTFPVGKWSTHMVCLSQVTSALVALLHPLSVLSLTSPCRCSRPTAGPSTAQRHTHRSEYPQRRPGNPDFAILDYCYVLTGVASSGCN
jgi:hypothetical protein